MRTKVCQVVLFFIGLIRIPRVDKGFSGMIVVVFTEFNVVEGFRKRRCLFVVGIAMDKLYIASVNKHTCKMIDSYFDQEFNEGIHIHLLGFHRT